MLCKEEAFIFGSRVRDREQMPHKAGAFKEKWGPYSLCQGAKVSLGVHGGRDVFHQKLTLLCSHILVFASTSVFPRVGIWPIPALTDALLTQNQNKIGFLH